MSRNKRIRWFAAILLLLLPLSAAASQTGSLVLQEIDHPVHLFFVADGDGHLTEDFADCGLRLPAENSARAAKALRDYVRVHHISGQTATPEQGEAVFEPLEKGTYLVCSAQTPGEFSPFLMDIPTVLNGSSIYHVTAKPKLDDDPPETRPTHPPKPEHSDSKIPQTGTSVIPRYVLMILGTMVTLVGLYEVVSGREEKST